MELQRISRVVRRCAVCAVLASALADGVWAASPADQAGRPARRGKSGRADDFFADRTVRHFEVEIAESALAALRRSPRTYVSGTVREGGRAYTNVGIHLKGMGSFQPLDLKPSLVLHFDEFTPGQEYCGLTKLMLNNSVQDRSYLSELLATGMFRDAGVPAARVTHALLTFNGRDLGLYVAIEAMNKRFLKHHFGDASGNLYEGYLRDIDSRLDQDNGTNTTQADVRALLAACRVPDPSERFQRLDQLLDLGRFASFAAIEILSAHWDGYTLHTNNYRMYHEPGSGKMVFIAHGLDAVFRRPNVSVRPPTKSAVSRAVFQTEPGRRLYEERLRTLYTNVFRLAVLTNRMDEALAKLRGAPLPRELMTDIEHQAAIMRGRLERRVVRVGQQLAGAEPGPLQFDASGAARPDDWRDDFDHGEPLMDRVLQDSRRTLHILARGARTRASWRTMIYLEPGLYRFEGQMRTANISGGGAGLRISGDTRNRRLGGENPWRSMEHDFAVKDEAGDVELVCEFDAVGGEAWYDLGSLVVRRR